MTKLKKSEKAILAISGLALLVFFTSPLIVPLAMFTYYDDSRKQMSVAKKYMDSLTDKDIQAWIQRSQKYLEEYAPTDFDAPPELQQLGISGIEELSSNEIDYVWLGGMDNTALDVV